MSVYYKYLNEKFSIDDEIWNILKTYGYYKPDMKDIIAISLTDKPGVLSVSFLNKKGRKREVLYKSIGRLLKKIYPDIDLTGDEQVQQMINSIKLLSTKNSTNFYVEIYDNITEWYVKLHSYGISSCVNDSERVDVILQGLDNNKNIQIAVMFNKNTNEPIGRALLWHNVKGLKKPFLDRTYPEDNTPIKQKFNKWAKEKNYAIRNGNNWAQFQYIDGQYNKLLSFDFKVPEEKIKVLPYMDTFKYGKESKGTFKIYNYAIKGYEYIFSETVGTYIGGYKYVDFVSKIGDKDSFGACSICGDIVETDDDYEIISEWDGLNRYRDTCIHGYCLPISFKKCDNCDRYMFTDESGLKNNKLYCPHCQVEVFGGHITECSTCNGNYIINEDICTVCNGEGSILLTYILNEDVEIDPMFKKVLNNYDYTIPVETPIKKIELTDKPGVFIVTTVDENGNETTREQRKIGKLLKILYPGIQTDGRNRTVTHILNDLKLLSKKSKNPYTVEIWDDVYEGYKEAHENYIESCVTWDGRLKNGLSEVMLSSLNECERCKIMVLLNENNKVVSRALLWEDCTIIDVINNKKSNNNLIDRVYPSGNIAFNSIFRNYARKKKWVTRDSSNEKFLFNTGMKPFSEFKVVPYMDTFFYGCIKNNIYYLMSDYELVVDKVQYMASDGPFDNQLGSFLTQDIQDELMMDVGSLEECVSCGDYYPEEEMFVDVMSNDLYCVHCADTDLFFCYNCNNYCNIDYSTIVHPNYIEICDNCIDTYSQCDNCFNYWEDLIYIENEGEDWCEDCTNVDAFKCDECKVYFSSIELNTIDNKKLCDDCYDDLSREED